MYEEAKMEKLTINLPPVEIARIDVLVESGLYPSRTEFIRTSIRKTLDSHHNLIERVIEEKIYSISDDLVSTDEYKNIFGVGVFALGKSDFDKYMKKGQKVRISVAGLLVILKGVTAEQILSTVVSVKVYGIIRASDSVRNALKKIKKS